ncbi:uncharacterized protein DS421_15g493690 [Arachis hypogaea]|nr:uncharacterized protein DS421_15g493690 [Arachis hypogaea]
MVSDFHGPCDGGGGWAEVVPEARGGEWRLAGDAGTESERHPQHTLEPQPSTLTSHLSLSVPASPLSTSSFRRNLRPATAAVASSFQPAFRSLSYLSFQPSKSQPLPVPVVVASVFPPAPALFDPSTPAAVPVAIRSAFFH